MEVAASTSVELVDTTKMKVVSSLADDWLICSMDSAKTDVLVSMSAEDVLLDMNAEDVLLETTGKNVLVDMIVDSTKVDCKSVI